MSLKTRIMAPVIRSMVSKRRLERRRQKAERQRVAAGERHRLQVFHQVDDPYSHLLLQALPLLAERYDITIDMYLVPPPSDAAVPDHERLRTFALSDARRLARKAGFDIPGEAGYPNDDALLAATAAFADAIAGGRAVEAGPDISRTFWAGRPVADTDGSERTRYAFEKGADALASLGHYQGAMIHHGGEWYWGLDRLHYLEQRLHSLGCTKGGDCPAVVFPPPTDLPHTGEVSVRDPGAPIEFFFSLRSPYSWLAMQRTFDLADRLGLGLQLRPVLPMVMRGLPVPRAKKFYILHDVAREARRLGVPFGLIADPLGKPVERGLAVFEHAVAEGRARELCVAFARGVWSQGIDAGSDRGLRRIVEQAGLAWEAARKSLADETWRERAEANRRSLLDAGLWGVPSFRLGSWAVWGQDRLWALADEASRRAGN